MRDPRIADGAEGRAATLDATKMLEHHVSEAKVQDALQRTVHPETVIPQIEARKRR